MSFIKSDVCFEHCCRHFVTVVIVCFFGFPIDVAMMATGFFNEVIVIDSELLKRED